MSSFGGIDSHNSGFSKQRKTAMAKQQVLASELQPYGIDAPPSNLSNKDLQQNQADLSRQQYLDYITRFRPYESQAINEYMTDAGMADREATAKTDANKAWDASAGVTSRALSDAGVNLSPDQQASATRRALQDRSAGIDNTMNNVRRSEEDRQLDTGDKLFQTGRAIESGATGQFDSLSSLAAQNTAAYQQAKGQASAANSANATGAATTAATLAYLIWSDPKLKKNIKRQPDAQALKDVRKMPVSTYEYKDQPAPDGQPLPKGKKLGPMATDMPADVKNPDGSISVQNYLGKITSALRELDSQVQALHKGAKR